MAHKKAPKVIRPFRVLVSQEDDWVCARVLEYNLAAQAKTLEGLYAAMERVVRAHIAARLENDQEPFEDLTPAPREYWDRFRDSKVPLSTQKLEIEIKRPTSIKIDRAEV